MMKKVIISWFGTPKLSGPGPHIKTSTKQAVITMHVRNILNVAF
jgi:hypothetical protein